MVAPAALVIVLLGLGLVSCEGRAGALPEVASSLPSAAASEPRCAPGTVAVDGGCRPFDAAYVGAGGTTFYVDGTSPAAQDDGPGTAARPWRTISRATEAGALRPGDAVLIRAGVYREEVRPRSGGTGPEARVTFAAYPGEAVVVTGADPADEGWRRLSDGAWERSWAGPALPSYSDDPVFRREMLVAAGAVMRPVYRREDVVPGTFWVDGPPEGPIRLVARFPGDKAPAVARPIEVAHRTGLFSPEGPDPYADCGDPATPGWIRVVGITFRHAANRAQWGAFCAGSEGSVVEDVRVEWTNGRGIDATGRGHVFRRTRADAHGQLGWGGACTGCLFEDGTAIGNNWKGHDPFWEAGGGKWVRTSESVIRRHYAADNGGPGIWFDIDNHDNTIEGSLVVGNEVAGIMLELRTTRTLVQHNVVSGTRWRGWSGTGVLSQAASGNAFVHNTITANAGTGLWLRLDPERRAPDGGNVVLNNCLHGNAASAEEAREIQVEGLTLDHVRSNRLDGNAYGAVAGDGVLRSTFFANTTAEEEYRGDDLRAWQAWMGGEGESGWTVGGTCRREAVPLGDLMGGAQRGPRIPARVVGAASGMVRSRGDYPHEEAAPRGDSGD